MRVLTWFLFSLSSSLLAQGAEVTPFPALAGGPSPAAATGFGAVRGSLVLEDVIADNQLLGVVHLDGKWYVSGGNNGQQPNKLYEYDAQSRTVRSFDQPTTSDWGMRDLATDGRYVYGGDESLQIQAFDTVTGRFLAPVDVRAAASGNQAVRALAWFEKLPGIAQPGFAFQDWNGPTVFVDMSGQLLRSHPSPVTSCYGLAYLEWVHVMLYFCQTDPQQQGGRVHAYGVDPATGLVIPHLQFHGDTSIPGTPPDTNGGLAGGVDIHIDGNRLVAAGLHQAVRDTVVTYELGVLSDFAVEGAPCGPMQAQLAPNGIPDLQNDRFGVELFSNAGPGTVAFWMVGFDDRSWNSVPLPFSTRSLGLDCFLRTSPDIVLGMPVASNGRGALRMPVPGDLALVDAPLHTQVALVSTLGLQSMSPKLSVRLGGVFCNWKWRILQEGCCALQIDAIYAGCAIFGKKADYDKCVCDTIKDTTATWCCTKKQRARYLKLNGC